MSTMARSSPSAFPRWARRASPAREEPIAPSVSIAARRVARRRIGEQREDRLHHVLVAQPAQRLEDR